MMALSEYDVWSRKKHLVWVRGQTGVGPMSHVIVGFLLTFLCDQVVSKLFKVNRG